MTHPPPSDTPDPYQPQQPYGPGPDPTTPYSPHPASPGSYGSNPYGPNPYGPVPYGAQQPYPAYGPQTRTNALAIASLACSLGGLITCLSAPVGIVLGHIARRQIRETGEQGEGLATAGLWVGYILTILGFLLIVGWLAVVVLLVNTNGTPT
jgi:hypothetical protein